MKNKTKTNFNKNKDKSNMSNSKIDNKKEKSNMKSNYNWQIHADKNGCNCDNDGDYILNMLPGTANFHTHGLEQYNHPDFQIVLDYDLETATAILNFLGASVRDGEKFKAGDYVKGIFRYGDARLEMFEESGRDVLRVIVPDPNNLFPDEEDCCSIFSHQLLPTEELYLSHYVDKCVRNVVILELNGGFKVEIIMNGDKAECYLCHNSISMKVYMFDIIQSEILDDKRMFDIIQSEILDDKRMLERTKKSIECFKAAVSDPDIIQDVADYHIICQYEQTISSYDIGDGFIVDAYNFKNGLVFYLSHRDCGAKIRMYSLDADTNIHYSMVSNIDFFTSVYRQFYMKESKF